MNGYLIELDDRALSLTNFNQAKSFFLLYARVFLLGMKQHFSLLNGTASDQALFLLNGTASDHQARTKLRFA
jgi:hypothetical protein